MNEPRYTNIEKSADYKVFTFISKGRYGNFTKIVVFEKLLIRNNTYNLALGTLLDNGKIDFESITNNGDRNKILATVVDIIFTFIQKYPEVDVFLTGSDNRRISLYQRAIIYGYDELIQRYNIYGDASTQDDINDFEPFDKDKKYSAFLIEKK